MQIMGAVDGYVCTDPLNLGLTFDDFQVACYAMQRGVLGISEPRGATGSRYGLTVLLEGTLGFVGLGAPAGSCIVEVRYVPVLDL